MLENVETIGEFASLFRRDYDKMKMKEGGYHHHKAGHRVHHGEGPDHGGEAFRF